GDEGPLQPVERAVHGHRAVAAPDQVEGGPSHVSTGHGPVGAALVGVARLGEEVLDLARVVPVAPPAGGAEHPGHDASSAASCPHAPSMSLPRVSRTVVGMPCARSRATNSAST